MNNFKSPWSNFMFISIRWILFKQQIINKRFIEEKKAVEINFGERLG